MCAPITVTLQPFPDTAPETGSKVTLSFYTYKWANLSLEHKDIRKALYTNTTIQRERERVLLRFMYCFHLAFDFPVQTSKKRLLFKLSLTDSTLFPSPFMTFFLCFISWL